MSEEDRDSRAKRRAINSTARDFMKQAHKSGNSGYTFEEAKRRVTNAVRKGDEQRDNNNR